MTTSDRSKKMYLLNEDLARAHAAELGGGRRRWRGSSAPRGHVARDAQRAQTTRLAVARLLYGGQPR